MTTLLSVLASMGSTFGGAPTPPAPEPLWMGTGTLRDWPQSGEDENERIVRSSSTAPDGGFGMEIYLLYQSVELDSFTYDLADFPLPEPTVGEVEYTEAEQSTVEVRFRFGTRAAGGYVGLMLRSMTPGSELSLEHDTLGSATFDLTSSNESDLETDVFGVGLGFDGFGRFGDAAVAFGLDYALGASVGFGSGGFVFIDSSQGNALFSDDDADVLSIQVTGRAGAGVDIRGLMLSLGYSALYESISFDSEFFVTREIEGDSTNAAPYFRAWYRSADFPLAGGAMAYFGDIEGFLVGFGYSR